MGLEPCQKVRFSPIFPVIRDRRSAPAERAAC
jgi:hypothetical protein